MWEGGVWSVKPSTGGELELGFMEFAGGKLEECVSCFPCW